MTRFIAPLLAGALLFAFAPQRAQAQTKTEKAAPAANISQQTISIELRDAPIRKALERLFDAVKADFMIEGTIKAGTVSARIKDKPFETVLKVLLEASTVPLIYERAGDVYIISPKPEPKPAPEPPQVARAEEKPIEITIHGDPNANTNNENPQEYSNPNYYAPTYWVVPAGGNWQIGGLSIGQGLTSWNNMGYGGLQYGAAGWPVVPSNIMFYGPQFGWGGYGGFARFP